VLERLAPLPRVQRVVLVGQNGRLVCCAFSSDEGEVDFASGERGEDVSAQERPEVVCRAVSAEGQRGAGGGAAEEHLENQDRVSDMGAGAGGLKQVRAPYYVEKLGGVFLFCDLVEGVVECATPPEYLFQRRENGAWCVRAYFPCIVLSYRVRWTHCGER
jgi:hypothetical protein